MAINTPQRTGATSLPADTQHHSLIIGIGAAFLTGAVLWFNGTYGFSQGGWGLAVAFLGFAIVKDGAMSYAWAARGEYGRLAAGILSLIALLISCLAAIGAASSGKQEASDPKAKAIERYDSAERTRTKAEARLEEIGKLPTADEAAAKASSLLAKVDASIAKRTQGCTVLAPANNGPRQVEANRVACQPWIDASALISKAQEAAELRAKLDAAEEVIAEGKPASADAQASTIAWFFGLFMKLKGIDSIQAMTNLFLGLGLEISSPLAWAAFANARRGHVRAAQLPKSTVPKSETVAEEDTEQTFAALKAAALSVAETHPLVAMFSGELPEPTPPKPGKRKKPVPLPANVVDFRQHPVVQALRSNGGSVSSNRELANLMSVTEGEASKRWQEIEHQLDVNRIGKRLSIALKA